MRIKCIPNAGVETCMLHSTYFARGCPMLWLLTTNTNRATALRQRHMERYKRIKKASLPRYFQVDLELPITSFISLTMVAMKLFFFVTGDQCLQDQSTLPVTSLLFDRTERNIWDGAERGREKLEPCFAPPAHGNWGA